MKSELVNPKAETKEKPFPKVMRGKLSGVVVGFIEPKVGNVLVPVRAFKLFESTVNWDVDMDDFEDMDEATIYFG